MNKKLIILLAFASFVVHAMSGSMLGVAWPKMQMAFGVPLDALGILLLVITGGYFVSSLGNGRLLQTFGIAPVLLIAWASAAVGLIGYTLAPSWGMLLVSGLLLGLGGGIIDAAINTYMAATFGPREMNWLHASFGVGATVAPLIIPAFSAIGLTWRYSYGFLAVIHTAMFIAILVTACQWRLEPVYETETSKVQVSGRRTLHLPIVWMGLLLYFLYVSVEVTTGQWTFTLFTQSRHIPDFRASSWVSFYWGSLTLGRLLIGFTVEHLGTVRALRASMVGVLLGTIILSVPLPATSFIGLILVGFSCAAIFPLLTSDTPQRVGKAHAANTVGFQIAASSLGLATMPGIAGVLADNVGLETFGPFLAILALLMWGVYEMMLRWLTNQSVGRLVS